MTTVATTDLRSAAFPRFSDEELRVLGRCIPGELRSYRAGEVLTHRGESEPRFHVIVSGEVAVVDDAQDPPRTLAVLGPGEFTGELAELTGAVSLVTIVARQDCEAYQVTSAGLRQILSRAPDLGDRMLQAFIARREVLRESPNFSGVRVVGSRYARDTFRIREFLAKNRVPFTLVDLDGEPHVESLLQRFSVTKEDTPLVLLGRETVLRNPSDRELARALGLHRPPDRPLHDLVVIGAGPAGLAAAVYGASEGLDTVVLERSGPGGQAGRSMRIENYLGFPTGITGADLAERAIAQAAKFGARVDLANVTGLAFESAYPTMTLDDGGTLVAKCLLIATGAEYSRIDAEGREKFEGCGVYYAATYLEAPICRHAAAVIVGGGNSAGQAAVFLSNVAKQIVMVVRGSSLSVSMSSYLAQRIQQTENIEVLLRTVVERLDGDTWLREVTTRHCDSGDTRSIGTRALFSFIGAAPRTDWLPADIAKDDKGFLLTGSRLPGGPGQRLFLETSSRGVFAAGDVRAGSVKRVASAVGEGAMAVQLVHEHMGKR